MTFPKEFKEAVAQLSSKEKDRLLLRLLKKDLVLANRLMFELVSDSTVEDRRNKLEERVVSQVGWMLKRFYGPGYLHMDLRYLSGEINEHVSVTKDKFGEVHLNLVMLNEVLEQLGDAALPFPKAKTRKFSIYIVARAFKILILISKMHEDIWMEFENLAIKLGQLMGRYPYIMETAIHHGFNVNWLLHYEIPENIVEINKNLRQNGYLK